MVPRRGGGRPEGSGKVGGRGGAGKTGQPSALRAVPAVSAARGW